MIKPDVVYASSPLLSAEELRQRLTKAVDITLEAGELARRYFLARHTLEVQTKGAHDWVSEADVAVETLIRQRLAAAFPQDQLLGEEHGLEGGTGSGLMWIIDPIDGTTCFLNGIPQWCVVLALATSNTTWLAVIHDPIADELYSAIRGQGAWCNERPLQVATAAKVGEGLISVGTSLKLSADKPTSLIKKLVGQQGMYTRIGACALGLSYVASGRLLGMYEPLVQPWDSWAGQLLVEEAGGQVLTFDQGARIDHPGPTLASTPKIWQELAWVLD